MSIRISNTSIHFGNFTLTANTEGFSFDGKIRARRGFVDSKIPTAQGIASGYASGGVTTESPLTRDNPIQRWSFASDGNATDVGDLTRSSVPLAGTSSKENGYSCGGVDGSLVFTKTIDKFPFAVDNNSTAAGDLFQEASAGSGQMSDTHGYCSGGALPSPAGGPPTGYIDTIQKFPFSIDNDGTDVGNLTTGDRQQPGGASSDTHGYACGGLSPSRSPAYYNEIDKYPFASDTNSTDVGNLTAGRSGQTGANSRTHGFIAGGFLGPSETNAIDKFPFASDTNAAAFDTLLNAQRLGASASSTTSGYCGGSIRSGAGNNTIEKYGFDNASQNVDVGDMTSTIRSCGGHQN